MVSAPAAAPWSEVVQEVKDRSNPMSATFRLSVGRFMMERSGLLNVGLQELKCPIANLWMMPVTSLETSPSKGPSKDTQTNTKSHAHELSYQSSRDSVGLHSSSSRQERCLCKHSIVIEACEIACCNASKSRCFHKCHHVYSISSIRRWACFVQGGKRGELNLYICVELQYTILVTTIYADCFW